MAGARYDAVADTYGSEGDEYSVPATATLLELVGSVDGMRVLDLALWPRVDRPGAGSTGGVTTAMTASVTGHCQSAEVGSPHRCLRTHIASRGPAAPHPRVRRRPARPQRPSPSTCPDVLLADDGDEIVTVDRADLEELAAASGRRVQLVHP